MMRRLVTGISIAVVLLTGCAQESAEVTPTSTTELESANETEADSIAESDPDTNDVGAPMAVNGSNRPVVAEGRILPVRSLTLSFTAVNVPVTEVLVSEGDFVKAGVPLASLDTQELELRVKEAQAMVVQAKASYEDTVAEATEFEVRQSEARVDRARSDLRQRIGSVTDTDIANARAEVEEAQIYLRELEAGPKPEAVSAAQASVDIAQSNLQRTRDAVSAAKILAQGEMEQSANRLRDLQAEYSQLYWDNRLLERDGPLPPEAIEREETAKRAIENAEIDLDQKKVLYEDARNAEITKIAEAEAKLSAAQSKLDLLLSGAAPEDIASARAQLLQSQANLERLLGEKRAGDIGIAQANLEGAQASLDELRAGASQTDITNVEAKLLQAEIELERAQLALSRATLRAPIDGTVAALNLTIGEFPSNPAVMLADFSSWEIVTNNLSELSVGRVREGDKALLSFLAIPDLELTGTVKRIRVMGANDGRNDTTYAVIITPDRIDERLRWNMTATVQIMPTQ
ncbi:MAG: biotin/lipoyl-binding protein [Chloroflexales bacterium]|nr:biotin/lipoyl-binding protein [Chloroflexales bacterium]